MCSLSLEKGVLEERRQSVRSTPQPPLCHALQCKDPMDNVPTGQAHGENMLHPNFNYSGSKYSLAAQRKPIFKDAFSL